MPRIAYDIRRMADMWTIFRNGDEQASYATQEAAFETAAAYASADLRTGHDIVIEAASPTDPRGARPLGGVPTPGDGFS